MLGDCGVSFGFDFGCFEWLRHVEDGCCCEGSIFGFGSVRVGDGLSDEGLEGSFEDER